ncbi:MAG TPA: hypothetical protein VN680_06330 [Burkholderiaceae bacterium]|nr:hypothetical protein [Burkholderiaceae bacterium]
MTPTDVAMARPCADCPFLKVGAIELRPGRVDGIVADLLADDMQSFICHQALSAKRSRRVQCAGSMAVLLKAGRPNVAMRLGASFGLIDLDEMRRWSDLVIDPPARKTGGG